MSNKTSDYLNALVRTRYQHVSDLEKLIFHVEELIEEGYLNASKTEQLTNFITTVRSSINSANHEISWRRKEYEEQ